MNYEEKRQVYLAISQLLADAGLDQQIIKEIVEKDIYNKIIIQKLNKTTNDGKFIEREIRKRMGNSYTTKNIVEEAEKEELKNKIIKFVFYECNNTSLDGNKPLTWEELQKMEEKPVWLKDNISGLNGWHIVFGCLKSPEQKLVLYDRGDGGVLSFELAKMGENGWQAYRKERL